MKLVVDTYMVDGRQEVRVSFPVNNEAFVKLIEAVQEDKKIQCIKQVRLLTGLGLKEAKELVESAGSFKPKQKGKWEKLADERCHHFGQVS